MFSTFDVLVESSLHDTAEKEFITVGWGKKETQFHGSVGKDGRRKEAIDIAHVDELDKKISCCWRGDGEYFAVNHVGVNGRMFKVYNKEGSLQYTSELCASLEVPIAWRPSGLWITKPEIHSNKYTITLFERNGLKHNELILPFGPNDEQVTNLSWSQDSEIFLIETCRSGNVHCLYFYTVCNYHWYLKHFMEFEDRIISNWSQSYTEPKQLFIITDKGKYSTFKFDFVVNSSNGTSDTDESIVAVIDGKKLLLTNFKSQMVPPPMASLEVALDVAVNIVDFLQHPNENLDSNCYFTVDHKSVIRFNRCIFEKTVNRNILVGTEIVKEFTVNEELITDAIWISAEYIILAKDSTVYLCSIDSQSIVHQLTVENSIGSILFQGEKYFILQLIDGTLVSLKIENSEIEMNDAELEKLPEFCETLSLVSSSYQPTIFALKHIKKKLYLNSKEVANECTSFRITNDSDYLIYTTIGELKFINIQNNETKIVDSRRIERGSRIVSLIKDKSQIIFQLPRGNLETISPRILSLKIIKRHLQNLDYMLAFDLLRKERINLNLLIDLNPQKFIEELKNFILQIDNVQWLNLFLTELKNEDVTTTMYKFCGVVDEQQENFDKMFTMTNKISFMCEKMLKIFQELDSDKYLLPSITCYVKNQQLEKALQMIWDLKKSGSGDKEADDALKYLLYLVDINVLYNIALGLYDYQMVLFVAQKSQKDPKEYVPFLNELNRLEPPYAKFKIDCFLKRYSKAIKHIAELSHDEQKFEECLDLTNKHQLYEAAMEAFSGNETCYQRICCSFADHLRIKGKFLDASLMYERGGECQQALSGARNILDWKRCIVLAKKCGFTDSEVTEMAMKLCNSLKESDRYKEASEIVQRFSPEDSSTLVEVLVSGKLYSEALLEVTMSGKIELLDTVVKPNLKRHLIEATNVIEDDKKLYLDQKERLLLVRQEKVKRIQNPQDYDDDMFSDTTSINSQSSKNSSRTFKSSKTRRKHERKLTNLKEGNKFEDVALIDSIWRLVHKVIATDYQNVIRDLLKYAVELSIDTEGKTLQVNIIDKLYWINFHYYIFKLQKAFKDFLLLIKHSMDDVWTSEMLSAGKYPENEEDMMQYNMDNSLANKMSYELISKFSPSKLHFL